MRNVVSDRWKVAASEAGRCDGAEAMAQEMLALRDVDIVCLGPGGGPQRPSYTMQGWRRPTGSLRGAVRRLLYTAPHRALPVTLS